MVILGNVSKFFHFFSGMATVTVSQGDSGHETLVSDEENSPTPKNSNNNSNNNNKMTERASSEVLYSSINNG